MPSGRWVPTRTYYRSIGWNPDKVWYDLDSVHGENTQGDLETIGRREHDAGVEEHRELWKRVVADVDWKRAFLEATAECTRRGHDHHKPDGLNEFAWFCREGIEHALTYTEYD